MFSNFSVGLVPGVGHRDPYALAVSPRK